MTPISIDVQSLTALASRRDKNVPLPSPLLGQIFLSDEATAKDGEHVAFLYLFKLSAVSFWPQDRLTSLSIRPEERR